MHILLIFDLWPKAAPPSLQRNKQARFRCLRSDDHLRRRLARNESTTPPKLPPFAMVIGPLLSISSKAMWVPSSYDLICWMKRWGGNRPCAQPLGRLPKEEEEEEEEVTSSLHDHRPTGHRVKIEPLWIQGYVGKGRTERSRHSWHSTWWRIEDGF